MMMFGKYPAVVVSYDGVTRLAKVKLEPLDEGADTSMRSCFTLWAISLIRQ